jgi:hypothetical protein
MTSLRDWRKRPSVSRARGNDNLGREARGLRLVIGKIAKFWVRRIAVALSASRHRRDLVGDSDY